MKKFNVYSILFVFAILFIIAGIWGTCFSGLKDGTIDMLKAIKQLSISRVMDAKDTIDTVSTEDLSYHDTMMDLDSLKNNLLGTRVVFKDDTTIVKSDTGSLCEPMRRVTEEDMDEIVSRIYDLKEVSEKNNAGFLYCIAPRKEFYEQLPSNVNDHSPENLNRFLTELKESEIPTINFKDVLKEKNISDSDIFYYTDHHWKADKGFLAASTICEELSSRYGFTYNKAYTDLNNYTVKRYPNWFLGSKGKKVGTYFTWHGADDFDMIIPNFETDMTEEQPKKGEVRNGTFEETVLFMEKMEKDYYHKSPYVTYSGGDFRLQIMKNNLNPNGKKIVLVRDSFACVVTPFLALQTSELHICDTRKNDNYVGKKMNLEKYIKKIKPDYVIVLYTGISTLAYSNGRYDFF